MAQYISKAALVAEINKRIMDAPIDCYGHQMVWAYNDIKDIIDTLEVKEVEEPSKDLEKEFDNYTKNILACDVQFEPFTHLYNCAKYFYELGLKAK